MPGAAQQTGDVAGTHLGMDAAASISTLRQLSKGWKTLIIVVRADPVVCGHSTEARSLAETAIALGYESVHIVSYPIHVLEKSGLPLKPNIEPYSDGIFVHRPEAVGDYKVLDGRLMHGMSGLIIDLLSTMEGPTIVMDLYLVPHGRIVMDAVRTVRTMPGRPRHDIITIAEAVGSDITSQVSVSLSSGRYGAVQLILNNYLEHDVLVAVSEYTKDCIVDAAAQVDAALGTTYAQELVRRVDISYPPINAAPLMEIGFKRDALQTVWDKYEVKDQQYVLFLSRLSEAKGVDDLINGYLHSKIHLEKGLPLLICGTGPFLACLQDLAVGHDKIHIHAKVSDEEKKALFYGCAAYVLPSKPTPTFIETFGIAIAEKMLAGGLGPVLTTRTGGIPEATGGQCLEIECSSPESITRQLDHVCEMTEAEKRELSNTARHYALRFDRQSVFNNLINLADQQVRASSDIVLTQDENEGGAADAASVSTSMEPAKNAYRSRFSKFLGVIVFTLLPKI